MTTDELRTHLTQIKYPGFSRDIVSFGLVRQAEMIQGEAHLLFQISTRDPKIPSQIFAETHALLDPLLGGPEKVHLEINVTEPEQVGPTGSAPSSERPRLPGVKKVLAVASGKGGVGKSTVAANLAVSLAQRGLRVGLCDCDLYGPSVPLLFGLPEIALQADEHDQIIPVEAHGVKLMSIGFLLESTSPVIVRGPLANRYTQQFLRQVAWGDLDVLLLDLPPGTGDIQLTIVQTLALDGSLLVTTPQEMALIDARKAASMFAKVNVPVTGIVENMAYFECEHGSRYPLFGQGGGEREAQRLQVPLLAQLPLEAATGVASDQGHPIALSTSPDSPTQRAFHALAEQVATKVLA